MGFEQMDAYEKTYVEREKPEVKEVSAKELQFHTPETLEEKEIVQREKIRSQISIDATMKAMIGLLIFLGIIGIVLHIAMDIDLEEILVFLSIPAAFICAVLVYTILRRRSLRSFEVGIAKVKAFEKYFEIRGNTSTHKYTYHRFFYYRVLQQETNLVVNRIRISREEYDSFTEAKMIYLVKLGKNAVEAVCD